MTIANTQVENIEHARRKIEELVRVVNSMTSGPVLILDPTDSKVKVRKPDGTLLSLE